MSELTTRFSKELEASSQGGPRPSVADFLEEVTEDDRPALRSELEAIERSFRDRPTIGPIVQGTTQDEIGPDGETRPYPPPAKSVEASTKLDSLATTPYVREPGSTVDAPSGGSAPARGQYVGPDPSRYTILGELGRGGMGVVYKAWQIGLDRHVALKMILAGAHARSDELDRFREEGKAVAAIDHENIVKIFDVGESDGLPYFALEFVEGANLAKYLEGKPIAPGLAATLCRTIALAIAAAHEKKIVHRDLKPANILMTRDGVPKVTDFGLAKRLEEESRQTHSGSIMGTPCYMSPEQAWGHTAKIGTAADIYALGAILYDCLTGRPPFQGVTTLETLDMVRHNEPVAPIEIQPGIPRDLETICLKCLQKDQERRYPSATELAEDLGRFLRDEPIKARPVSTAERAWRWARRNPRVAALSSTVALLLLTVAIGSTFFAIRLADETQKARDAATKAETARGLEAVAREKEAESAATAKKSLDLTIKAVRTFLLKVQDELRRPGLADTRESIVKLAMTDLDEVRKFSLQSPLMNRTDASTLSLLGSIYVQVGRITDAQALYERAFALLEAEARRDPDNPVATRNLAAATNSLGDVEFRLGDGVKARERYASALELRRAWAKRLPNEISPRLSIAESLSLLGQTDLLLGDPESAGKELAASLKEYQGLPKSLTDDPRLRRSMAAVEDMLGIVKLKLNDPSGAEAQHLTAQKQRLALLNDTKDRTVRRDIALSQLSFGDLFQMSAKDPVRAWTEYSKAKKNFDELLKQDEKSYAPKRDLSVILYRLGDTAERLKASGAKVAGSPPLPAATYFAECLKIREELAEIDPKDTQARIYLMIALTRCDRAAEAVKLADGLIEGSKGDPRLFFQSACALSLCGTSPDAVLAAQARDRAIQVIGDLVKNGWKDRYALETDPDLEAIRADPRFAKAIAGLPPLKPNTVE